MWKDNNDKIDELWMEFLTKTYKYPKNCPVCGKPEAHVYLRRYKGDKGTVWLWCSSCKACSHGTFHIPDWWIDDSFVDINKTASHPDYLESVKDDIDTYVNSMLR